MLAQINRDPCKVYTITNNGKTILFRRLPKSWQIYPGMLKWALESSQGAKTPSAKKILSTVLLTDFSWRRISLIERWTSFLEDASSWWTKSTLIGMTLWCYSSQQSLKRDTSSKMKKPGSTQPSNSTKICRSRCLSPNSRTSSPSQTLGEPKISVTSQEATTQWEILACHLQIWTSTTKK